MDKRLQAVALVSTLLAAACGGNKSNTGGASTANTVTTNSVTPAGDVQMSGSLGVTDGKLDITLSAIRDPDDVTKPADPANVALEVSTAAVPSTGYAAAAGTIPPALSCSLGKVSSASGAKIDLVFINDTTGSMSGTVEGIASSIQAFAEGVAASGVDASFSMFTYGDTFATKRATGSEVTVGQGDYALPDLSADCYTEPVPAACNVQFLDDVERPYVGLSDLTTFKSFLAEMNASSALGNGGGDGPENTIGTLDYAKSKVAFRDGAAKVYIAIGDNPSHQEGDTEVAGWLADFQPKTGADLVSRFRGSAVIHVVGNDTPDSAPYYNLKGLADGTGGVFLELPYDGNVDLGSLHLSDWFTNAFTGSCSTAPVGHYLVIIHVTVTGSVGTVRTGTLTFDITVS